jgi:hypothetical protein
MRSPHPYSSAPKSSFWSRSVARDWRPTELVQPGEPLIRTGERVVSAGSCFAANIVPHLERAGFIYVRTEARHPGFSDLPTENLSYEKFSAAYGNIYTPRQLLQMLKRCLGAFVPVENKWVDGPAVIDPFRPGLRYHAVGEREFEVLTEQHLARTLQAFQSADVFVFTLGLTEAWISKVDGAVFPACPGTVAGSFDPSRHEFINFSVADTTADLDEFVRLLREINNKVRILLTVSPVPLIATATNKHVVEATVYSKSVLRVAAAEIVSRFTDVFYFPAYEIITGPQARAEFFENDKRSVSQAGVDAVVSVLLAHCEGVSVPAETAQTERGRTTDQPPPTAAAELGRLIAEAECEEAMADLSTRQD